MIKKYRKKPVVIEAMLLLDDNLESAEQWMAASGVDGYYMKQGNRVWLDIPTLEGTLQAEPGMWLIKGLVGEFYPCRTDVFDATYEEATE